MLQDFLVFAPVVETKIDEAVFLADRPEVLTNSINTTIPLMIGITKDEGISFFSGTFCICIVLKQYNCNCNCLL